MEQTQTTGRRVRRIQGVTAKLAAAIVICVVLAVGTLLAVVYGKVSATLLEKSEKLLQTTTDKTLQETSAWMNKVLTMLEMQRDVIVYEDMDLEEMKEYILHTVGQNEAYPAGLYVALTDGSLYHASFVPGLDFDAASKSWYQDGIASEKFILGDVYFDEDSQSYVVGASGVLKNPQGEVRGVAAADVYLDSISKIVGVIQLEKTGGIFLVDTRTGTIIGHRDPEIVGQKLDQVGGSMYDYAAQQINTGKTGLSLFENTYIQVANVPDSDWAAVAYVSRAEVLSDLHQLTVMMVSVAAATVAALILLVIILARRIIGRPVAELSQVAARIAEGDLDQTIKYQSGDELGVLADNFNRTTLRLRNYVQYIDEISLRLKEIAGGNLDFTLENQYTGEFEKLKVSLEEISNRLSDTLGQLRTASQEVAAGAQLVSGGAVSLSQGSAEQAGAVMELASHISSMSESVQETAGSAQEANRISEQVKQGLLESSAKMENMNHVIQRISDKSTEINGIVKKIDNIAFQTNILALNAAVEAARAGEAGKGFAVVADEVRALAGKSSAAARETTALLSETVESMEEGTQAARETSDSMLAVMDQAEQVSGLIHDIAQNTERQAEDAAEISHGIDQISHVVESNVDTAQKSATASEELSGQA
ncbi:MAG: HAMP domain-containing protein, partial [Acutalibacter sp.]|nr:HAMP domain-containing protein [Acutalibacter sp.]